MEENQTKSAFFDMSTGQDMYKKQKYEYKRINQNSEYVVYDYLNFFFTAYHLKEWIKNDKSFEKKMYIEDDKKYEWLRTICNRSKHYILTNRHGEKSEDNYKLKTKRKGFDFRYVNFNNFSFSPIHYYIYMDNQELNLHTFAREILDEYKKFFDKSVK